MMDQVGFILGIQDWFKMFIIFIQYSIVLTFVVFLADILQIYYILCYGRYITSRLYNYFLNQLREERKEIVCIVFYN